MTATRLVATGNDFMGVRGRVVRLIDSTVTGNGEVGLPMDIATDRRRSS